LILPIIRLETLLVYLIFSDTVGMEKELGSEDDSDR
jgi:hypothetical protein